MFASVAKTLFTAILSSTIDDDGSIHDQDRKKEIKQIADDQREIARIGATRINDDTFNINFYFRDSRVPTRMESRTIAFQVDNATVEQIGKYFPVGVQNFGAFRRDDAENLISMLTF